MNPNLEELDPNFIQGYNSNKSCPYEDSSVNMENDNNTTNMKNEKEKSIREYVVFNPTTLHTSIVRPKVTIAQFEFKPIMFQDLQIIGQFSGAVADDLHLHLKQFTEVVENFKIPGVEDDGFKLRLFPYSLIGRVKAWLNSLESNSATTWRELDEKFFVKYFPPVLNARKRNDITFFRQINEETLFEACGRFTYLLRRCRHNRIHV